MPRHSNIDVKAIDAEKDRCTQEISVSHKIRWLTTPFDVDRNIFHVPRLSRL